MGVFLCDDLQWCEGVFRLNETKLAATSRNLGSAKSRPYE